MAHWDASGITAEMVSAAENSYDECDGDMFRFQIIGGKLYVYHITQRGGGWYPAILGPGNLSARGRVPYSLLILLQVLRLFPGQIPDVDAVMHVGDFTCTNATAARLAGRVPLPMFGASTSDASADVPFPDFSYFGHEHRYLMDPSGDVVMGWDLQREILEAKYAHVPLAHRIPRAMWRGRTVDKLYPMRDELRRRIAACPATLRAKIQGTEGAEIVGLGADAATSASANGSSRAPLFPSDAALFDLRGRPQVLQDFGDFRYLLHIEPQAWASNVRQKLASGSVVVQPGLDYYEWYTRALRPGVDYVVLDPNDPTVDVCDALAAIFRDMNALVDREAKLGREAVEKETRGGASKGLAGKGRLAGEEKTTPAGEGSGSKATDKATVESASTAKPAEKSPQAAVARAVAEDASPSGPGSRRRSRSRSRSLLAEDAQGDDEASPAVVSGPSSFASPRALPTLTSPYETLPSFALASGPSSASISRVEPVGLFSIADFTSTPTLEVERESTRRDPATAGLLSGSLDVAPGPAGTTPQAAKAALEAAKAKDATKEPAMPTAPFRWGSDLLPWEIAANGAAFAKEKMREIDAMIYARDVLKAYAKRQRFTPEVYEKAECYDGEKVLQQFGYPHQEDRDVVAKAYPWLEDYTGGCAER